MAKSFLNYVILGNLKFGTYNSRNACQSLRLILIILRLQFKETADQISTKRATSKNELVSTSEYF